MIEKINPAQAAELLTEADTVLVDVRTTMEYKFVGHPPNVIHIPWQEPPTMEVNPDFTQQLESRLQEMSLDRGSAKVILMCRSGKRSEAAAAVLQQAGFQNLFDMLEGFEGDLDDNKHRNTINGWRQRGLPWEQT